MRKVATSSLSVYLIYKSREQQLLKERSLQDITPGALCPADSRSRLLNRSNIITDKLEKVLVLKSC